MLLTLVGIGFILMIGFVIFFFVRSVKAAVNAPKKYADIVNNMSDLDKKRAGNNH